VIIAIMKNGSFLVDEGNVDILRAFEAYEAQW
jgi:hypothetical protein